MRTAGATAAARIADGRAVETGHRDLATLLAEGGAGSGVRRSWGGSAEADPAFLGGDEGAAQVAKTRPPPCAR